jgi:nucleoside 2-deoxyribosyltransferase
VDFDALGAGIAQWPPREIILEEKETIMSTVNTVISGSYRKHFREMVELKTFLKKERIEVLAPVCTGVVNPGEEFILLDDDPIHDPRTLQDSILAKIRASSFLVLANVDGYIGKAATFEMGYAVSQGIQILTIAPVEDPNLAGYCRPIEQVFPNWRSLNLKAAERQAMEVIQ